MVKVSANRHWVVTESDPRTVSSNFPYEAGLMSYRCVADSHQVGVYVHDYVQVSRATSRRSPKHQAAAHCLREMDIVVQILFSAAF